MSAVDDPRPAVVALPTELQTAARPFNDRRKAVDLARLMACEYLLRTSEEGDLASARAFASAAVELEEMSNEDFAALRAEAQAQDAKWQQYIAASDAWYARRDALWATRPTANADTC